MQATADITAAPVTIDEPALVRAAQGGCTQSFELLYRAHVGKVRGLIWQISGCSAKADDLTQDTFVQAWRKLGSFRVSVTPRLQSRPKS